MTVGPEVVETDVSRTISMDESEGVGEDEREGDVEPAVELMWSILPDSHE